MDDAATLLGWVQDYLLFLAGGYMGVLTWVFKRQIGRIDVIESQHREYITRTEFDAKFAELKRELRDSDKDIQVRLDTIVNLLLQERRGTNGHGHN